MNEASAWSDLIQDLYSSVLDRDAADRLPGRFNALMAGSVANFWRLDARTLAVKDEPITNLPPEVWRSYCDTYHRHDPWAPAVTQARLNVVLHGPEIVPEAEVARSLYYNEFAERHGMFHLVAALVPVTPGHTDTFGAVSVLRPRQAGAFEGREAKFLGHALPHIAGAFRLRGQLGKREQSLRADALGAALEMLGQAALVLDGQCGVLAMNAEAELLPLVRSCCSRRTNPHRIFVIPGQHALTTLVADAAQGGPGGELRVTHGTTAYLATITRLPAALAALTGRRGQALLLLRDVAPASRPGPAARLTTLFGLTPAEAASASILAEGLSPTEIAAARGVKVSTVRTQLQRAQDKVGCNTLRELVRRLAALS